ncbi:universal stress protein [bacterium]|nr:universal stress protein [bacterium]
MIKIDNILVPTDCSELSQNAARFAVDFARKFNANLTLLMVTATEALTVLNDYGYFSPELHQKLIIESSSRAESQLKEFWNSVADPDIKANLVNVKGDAFYEIIRYAEEKDIDLIVMGTHGRTGIKHIVMGSVAEKVVRYSPTPVLTIKHAGYKFEIND